MLVELEQLPVHQSQMLSLVWLDTDYLDHHAYNVLQEQALVLHQVLLPYVTLDSLFPQEYVHVLLDIMHQETPVHLVHQLVLHVLQQLHVPHVNQD